MNRRITDYMTIRSNSDFNLDKEVKEMIGQGWQPFGGPAMAFVNNSGSGEFNFTQAMVRYDSTEVYATTNITNSMEKPNARNET